MLRWRPGRASRRPAAPLSRRRRAALGRARAISAAPAAPAKELRLHQDFGDHVQETKAQRDTLNEQVRMAVADREGMQGRVSPRMRDAVAGLEAKAITIEQLEQEVRHRTDVRRKLDKQLEADQADYLSMLARTEDAYRLQLALQQDELEPAKAQCDRLREQMHDAVAECQAQKNVAAQQAQDMSSSVPVRATMVGLDVAEGEDVCLSMGAVSSMRYYVKRDGASFAQIGDLRADVILEVGFDGRVIIGAQVSAEVGPQGVFDLLEGGCVVVPRGRMRDGALLAAWMTAAAAREQKPQRSSQPFARRLAALADEAKCINFAVWDCPCQKCKASAQNSRQRPRWRGKARAARVPAVWMVSWELRRECQLRGWPREC
ncbi:unnamed protein product [Prorocentrum cordatum]|uniref:Uncharacterized protein n=1 Tax=Prorocentrum cordatum TaxID=2364126 RepID=A0ABN9SDC3_9DINO|nr:unnamed protein product [Polarella glacialis]